MTLFDAHKVFNGISLLVMIWTVRHLWPARERLALKFYWHKALLFFGPSALCRFIRSREEVTQGDTLSMVLYCLDLILMDETMKE